MFLIQRSLKETLSSWALPLQSGDFSKIVLMGGDTNFCNLSVNRMTTTQIILIEVNSKKAKRITNMK